MELVLKWGLCFLSKIIEYNYLKKVLQKRRQTNVLIVIPFLLLLSSIQFSVNLLNKGTWNLIIFSVTILLSIVVLFRVTWKDVLVNYALITAFMMGAEFIVAMIYSNIIGEEINGPVEESWVEMISLMIRYLLFVVIEKNTRLENSSSRNIVILKAVYPFVTILLLLKTYQLIGYAGGESYGTEWICMLLIVINVLSFIFIDQTMELIRKTERYQRAEEINQLKIERYKELEREEKVWREREHDLTKNLAAIGGLAKEKKDEEILSVLGGMQLKIDELGRDHYVKNSIIDALLRVKISEAEREGINIDFYAEPNIGFEGYEIGDIIAIVGNQIENAIEASMLCGDNKRIWARYYNSENRQIVLEMENYCAYEPKQKGGRYQTNKVDEEQHGLGIQIMQEVVEKNGGIIKLETNKKKFRSVVILPLEHVA